MIIVLKPHTTKDDVSRVENMVKKRGLDIMYKARR